jgi:hypothetical protein
VVDCRPRACHAVGLLQELPPHQRRVRLVNRSSIKWRHAGRRLQGSVIGPIPCGGQVISVSRSRRRGKSCRTGYAVLRRYGASRIIGQCTSVRPSLFQRFSPRCASRSCATRTLSAGRSVVLGPRRAVADARPLGGRRRPARRSPESRTRRHLLRVAQHAILCA